MRGLLGQINIYRIILWGSFIEEDACDIKKNIDGFLRGRCYEEALIAETLNAEKDKKTISKEDYLYNTFGVAYNTAQKYIYYYKLVSHILYSMHRL